MTTYHMLFGFFGFYVVAATTWAILFTLWHAWNLRMEMIANIHNDEVCENIVKDVSKLVRWPSHLLGFASLVLYMTIYFS